MKTETTAADLLRTRGFTFDIDRMTKMYEAAGIDISEEIISMHEIYGVLMIDAYNAGQEGKPLSSVAPWLVKE